MPSRVPESVNWTLPVGAGPPDWYGITMAVKVARWPSWIVDGEAVNATLVNSTASASMAADTEPV